jgi:type IV pilus assembly protein PilY1
MGAVFGRPILAKMRDGKWRAIVGNGYNSANGHAVLMLIDLETGAVTRIDTKAGNAASPNGLSGVAVVSTADNGVADVAYAGDLYGNLWKFDLSSTNPADWKSGYGDAAAPLPLFSTGGQSITARPDVARFPKGGYMVTVGTGRYVDVNDNAAGAGQTIYGIWDNGSTVVAADLQVQSIFGTVAGAAGGTFRLTTHAVGAPGDQVIPGDNAISLANYYATKKGWKLNLVTAGERVVAETTVRFGRVIISTLIPSVAVCSFGGDGWIMDVDVITGNRQPALDTNGDNKVDINDYVNGTMVSGVKIGAVPAAASIMRTKDRKLDDKLINTSAGTAPILTPETIVPLT